MSLYTRLLEMISDETGFSNTPDSITIEWGGDSVWKAGVADEILFTTKWWGENVPESCIEPMPDDPTEMEVLDFNFQQEQHFISIDETHDLFRDFQSLLLAVENTIEVTSGATIDTLSVSPNIPRETTNDSEERIDADWAGELTGEFGGFLKFTVERELSEQGTILLTAVENALKTKYETNAVTEVLEAELLFDDFRYNSCHYCEVTFETTDPTEFFDATPEEYAEAMSDDETSVDELLSQETYRINLRIDIELNEDDEIAMGREYLDETVAEQAEALMESTVFNTTGLVVETAPMEGERITLTRDTEEIVWWMRPQVDESDISQLTA